MACGCSWPSWFLEGNNFVSVVEGKFFWRLYCRTRMFCILWCWPSRAVFICLFHSVGGIEPRLSTKEVSSFVRFGPLGSYSGFFSPNSKRLRMVTIWFTLISATIFVVVMAAVWFHCEKLTFVHRQSPCFYSPRWHLSCLDEGQFLWVCTVSRLQPCFELVCVFFGEMHRALSEESCLCTMNEKYSDPFEQIILKLTFCRYPMRHSWNCRWWLKEWLNECLN